MAGRVLSFVDQLGGNIPSKACKWYSLWVDKQKSKTAKAKQMVIEQFVPGATGIIKSALDGGGDIVQAISNTIQRSGKAGLFQAFLDELEKMKEKGKAPPDFIATETGRSCLQELMDFLEKELPDQARFDAMKSLFFRAADADTDEASKARCLQLMRVCRTLDATELLILSVVYRENQRRRTAKPSEKEVTGSDEWPRVVAAASGTALSIGLVEHYENRLIDKRLIGERQHTDRSGIRHSDQFRLTHLGLELGALLQAPNEKA